MESFRIHLAAHFLRRHATLLNEEHCVTKHKTAAKTVNRDFTTIEVEISITLFA